MKFTELKLDKNILKGIEEAGFTTLMPVQEATLTYTLKGRDATVQSQTGTGKTAAFLITIFHHFLDKNNTRNKKALIVTPTRELAVQIEKDAKQLGRYLPFTIGSFYGGIGYHEQEELLRKNVDIIIGTPGRLLDFHYQRKLDFKQMGYVVIDEADRLFDMGFAPDITRIMRNSVSSSQRQTMLYSATLDVNTRRLAREFMNSPAKVEITPEQVTVETITQVLYHVAQREKLNLMLGVLKREAPKNALIFTNTKRAAHQVARHLEYNGYICLHISGDLPQNKRLKVIEDFKSGKLPFLVATDVAARGLHIEGLEMIINYDLPGDPENYVHRIGRTARAGKSGKAISMACEDYVYNLDAIETFINMKIPVAVAQDEFFEKSKSQGMVFNVKDKKPARVGEVDGRRRQKTAHARRPDHERRRKDENIPKEKPKPSRSTDAKETRDNRETSRANRKDHPVQKDSRSRSTDRQEGRRDRKAKPPRESRLEYYRKKYGDNFKPPAEAQVPRTAPTPKAPAAPEVKQPTEKKKSLLTRLKELLQK
ncbi:MAG: ATP-dependent helicase RhlB [Acidobacteriota bacterium]|nr:ATP-dependent helicase RhlB [Acidobacteriota bacterium]